MTDSPLQQCLNKLRQLKFCCHRRRVHPLGCPPHKVHPTADQYTWLKQWKEGIVISRGRNKHTGQDSISFRAEYDKPLLPDMRVCAMNGCLVRAGPELNTLKVGELPFRTPVRCSGEVTTTLSVRGQSVSRINITSPLSGWISQHIAKLGDNDTADEFGWPEYSANHSAPLSQGCHIPNTEARGITCRP